MQNKKEVEKRGTLALVQILILVIGIIAIGYALESSVQQVSALDLSDVDCYESGTCDDNGDDLYKEWAYPKVNVEKEEQEKRVFESTNNGEQGFKNQ